MNHDDHKPDIHPLIDPELEARVVAWVAGEASPFEVAELTRLIGEKPELGIFKRRIEAVHGLAADAVRLDHPSLRLSDERRAKLLQMIGGKETTASSATPPKPLVPDFNATKKAQRQYRQWSTAIATLAACAAVGFIALLSAPHFGIPHTNEMNQKAVSAASIKREELTRFALRDEKRHKGEIPLELPMVAENPESLPKYGDEKPSIEQARKVQVDEMAFAATKKLAEQSARQLSRSYGAGKIAGPLIASSSLATPVVNHYISSDRSKLKEATSFAVDSTRQLIAKGGSIDLDNLVQSTREDSRSRDEGKEQAAGKLWNEKPDLLAGAKTKSETFMDSTTDKEKLTFSPFTVAQSANVDYSSQNPLAGSRIRTELKDIGSTITVVTNEFLAGKVVQNGEQLLAYTTAPETGGVRGNFEASAPTREPKDFGVVQSAPAGTDSFGAQPSMPFAIRVAALKDDENYHQKPEYAHPNINYPSTSQTANHEAFALPAFGLQPPKSIVAGYEALSKPASPVQASEAMPSKKSEADRLDEDRPLAPSSPKPAPIAAPVEVNASKEPISTFSLHVSDVSFRLAQAALANNETIDPARIRPEEFYNAFSYGDPTPTVAEKVSCRIEQAAHPFLQQRNLVRIALKVAASGHGAAQPLHLTILLDTSGSMEREDRSTLVHRAMETLVSLLGPNDRITLIGFARQPSLLAESLPGDQCKQILDIIAHVPAEGGTNLEEALKLGAELAHRQFEPTAQNRIVLLTDGAANLGNASPAQLAASIEVLRQQGIAFDACGVGLEGLDDAMLENLTRKGDGRYYVLNSPEAADASFAHQLAGAFRPAAENVKLQVRFNPARVGNYRLIGFEQHRLREEDFRNDSVNAAELAAEEAAVAVYQVETLPQGEGELGEVYVRFRDAASGNMVERSWTLSYDPQSPAFDRATPSMQLAGTAALLAEKLRGGQTGDVIKLSELAPVVAKLRSHYASELRVQELATMFEQMRRQAGE